MTIASNIYRNDYIGNGSTATYGYGFKIFNQTHVLVTVRDSDNNETTLDIGTHYSVTNIGNANGGNIVLVDGDFDWIDDDGFLADGFSFSVRLYPPLEQQTDIRNQGAYYAVAHENQFDKCVQIDQKQQDEIDRSTKLPETVSPSDVSVELPVPVSDQYIGWNSAADALENKVPSITTSDYNGNFSAGADASKAANPTSNDVYIATDTHKVYICFSSGTWTNILTVAGLDADKPASPTAGLTYFATDTGKVYRCFVAGTWTTKMVFGHAVNFAKGADIASATTCDIGAATGNLVHITGTTPITGFGTVQAGTLRIVVFDGILTLTHNGTTLILDGANITTGAGDVAVMVSEGSGNWRCASYKKATGPLKPVTGSAKALKCVWASAATYTTTADEIIFDDGTKGSSVNVTASTATAGPAANGRDQAGAFATDIWIYKWLIKKSSDGTIAGLWSASATAPTLPVGYDSKVRVLSAKLIAGDLFFSKKFGNKVMFCQPFGVLHNGTQTGYTGIDCSGCIPPIANIGLFLGKVDQTTNNGVTKLWVRATGDPADPSSSDDYAVGRIDQNNDSSGSTSASFECEVNNTQSLDYKVAGSGAQASIAVKGYIEN